MINEIEIKNFRAFEHTRIKGFGAVNLIGGENNVGKTSLLEALLIYTERSSDAIIALRKMRRESDHLIQSAPETLWDYLFYKRKKKEEIFIDVNGGKWIKGYTTKFGDYGEEYEENFDFSETALNLSIDNGNIQGYGFFKDNSSKYSYHYTMFSIKIESQNDKNIFNYQKSNHSLPFIKSTERLSEEELINLFTQAKKDKKIKAVVNILAKIDKQIVNLSLDGTGGDKVVLAVDTVDEEVLPLGMFGDAVRKATELLLIALTSDSKAIFIDEIENGIHYTKQADLWQALFTIAKEREIQIFATTHSKEMIEAFARVGGQAENEGQGVYFEMYRSPRSQQIVAAPHKIDILDNKLKRGESLRGEVLV